MNRDDIHIISRHSNWSKHGVNATLKEAVYADAKSWKKFLQLLLISLSVGFGVTGVVFFFAYNWAYLHKFAKIGIAEGLVVMLTLAIVFLKLNERIKNIVLTGVAVLVGVMLAVFGQIYQTGANAYDFFLGWTAFITLWVFIASYPPLWLVYIILINTTLILYSKQVASNWSPLLVSCMLTFFNAFSLLVALYLTTFTKELKVPSWFTHTIALAVVLFATVGICIGIFDNNQTLLIVLSLFTASIYGCGAMYGLQTKSGFYLSIIPFSVIVIVSTFMVESSTGEGMLFTVSLFIIISITTLIKTLFILRKKWNNE